MHRIAGRAALRTAALVTCATLAVGITASGDVHGAPSDLDPAYGVDGIATVDAGFGTEAAAVVVLDDGTTVVGGTTVGGWGGTDFVVARFDSTGTLDPTFGSGGVATTDFGGGTSQLSERAAGVAVQPDGKIVVAGSIRLGSGPRDIAVARYLPNGTLDPTFDADGLATTDLGSDDAVAAILARPDGTLVAAGRTGSDDANADAVLLRYTADGALDPTFGAAAGVTTVDLGPGEKGALALAVDAGGRLLMGGRAHPPGGPAGHTHAADMAVLRFTSQGVLDPTFGGDGIVTTDTGDDTYGDDAVFDLLLQPDGKIVATGRGAGGLATVVRYGPAGTLDPAFGGDGIVSTPSSGPTSFRGAGRSIVGQVDGKLVVGGSHGSAGPTGMEEGFALMRLTPDGSFDATFDADGVFVHVLAPNSEYADLALQPDGRLVAVGATMPFPSRLLVVARHQVWEQPRDPVDPALLVGAPGAADDQRIAIVGSRVMGPLTDQILVGLPDSVRSLVLDVDAQATTSAATTIPSDPHCQTFTLDSNEGPEQLLTDTDSDARMAVPNTSDSALQALLRSADPANPYGSAALDTRNGCIDVARVTTGPQPGSPTSLEHYTFALDAIGWGSTSLNAPVTLSLPQLRSIYGCSNEAAAGLTVTDQAVDLDDRVNNWGEVGGVPGRITRALPPVGSDSHAFFVEHVLGGIAPANGVAGCADIVVMAENDGTSLLSSANEARYDEYIVGYSASRWVYQTTNRINPTLDRRGGVRMGSISRSPGVACLPSDRPLQPNNAPVFPIRYDGSGFLLNGATLVCAAPLNVDTVAISRTLSAPPGTFLSSDLGSSVEGDGIYDGATIVAVAPDGATATMNAVAKSTAFASEIRIGVPPVNDRNPNLVDTSDTTVYPGVRAWSFVLDRRSPSYGASRALFGFQNGTADRSPLCNGAHSSAILSSGLLDLVPLDDDGTPDTTCRRMAG